MDVNPDKKKKAKEPETTMELLHKEQTAQGADSSATEEDEKVVLERIHKISSEHVWARFDSFFGLFVVANGACIGLETTKSANNISDAAFDMLEIGFLLVFSSELLLRAMLFYQVEYLFIYTQLFGVFPQPEDVKPGRICMILPAFLNPRRDWWVLFDLAIVLIAATNVIAKPILEATGNSDTLNQLTMLRVFRLFRLMRLAKILKLFRKLQLLVDGMIASFRILLWSILLLVLMNFMFVCIAKEIFNDDFSKDERDLALTTTPEYEYFGTILRGMLTLTQFATFEDWTSVTRHFVGLRVICDMGFCACHGEPSLATKICGKELAEDMRAVYYENNFIVDATVDALTGGVPADYQAARPVVRQTAWAATAFFVVVLAFGGLACMSLIVGVMVESAFRLAQEEKDRAASAALGPLRQVIRDLAAEVVGMRFLNKSAVHQGGGRGGIIGMDVQDEDRDDDEMMLPQNSMAGQMRRSFVDASGVATATARLPQSKTKLGKSVTKLQKSMTDKVRGLKGGSKADMPSTMMNEEDRRKKQTDLADMWISLSDLSELGRVEQDNEVLLDALKKADLGWKDVWMIAMKLDVYGTGKIRLNELTETLLRSKSGIHGLDISATPEPVP